MLFFAKDNKKAIAIRSLQFIDKFSGLLLIKEDSKKEIAALDKLVEEFAKKDGQNRTFLILLQNNMELRPGGGFLGQHAVIKVKDGEIISTFIEDSNLLDQRITAKIPAPYPFKKMMGTKKWKFRDSNFSPDFPENAEKAKYFYRLSGRDGDFDGVIAVNSDVLSDILELVGPISVPGYAGVYDSQNVVLKLEEQVEKPYLMNSDLDTQNRKDIIKKMAPIIINKALSLGNITKLAELGRKEMQNKNIMLYFKDPVLQELADSVYWSGRVSKDWGSDYLMLVDANMGALKTDYYMKREISYEINLTGEKPIATLYYTYKNTAPRGDWRTSDYHSYLRVYVPEGSTLLEREMVSYPNVKNDLGKTYFGFTAHTLIGSETKARIKYELPPSINKNNYSLLIQKQSGTGDIPVKVKIITPERQLEQQETLIKDLKFELK